MPTGSGILRDLVYYGIWYIALSASSTYVLMNIKGSSRKGRNHESQTLDVNCGNVILFDTLFRVKFGWHHRTSPKRRTNHTKFGVNWQFSVTKSTDNIVNHYIVKTVFGLLRNLHLHSIKHTNWTTNLAGWFRGGSEGITTNLLHPVDRIATDDITWS